MYYSSGNYEAFARPQKPQGVDEKSAYLIGSGLAALAAACYLVRDGQMAGERIHILEKDPIPGGACDGYQYTDIGYVMRGGREMDNHFECMWDEYYWLNKADPNYSLCRATEKQGQDAHTDKKFGLSDKAAMEIMKLFFTPDEELYNKRIDEIFDHEVLDSNFWLYWRTMFAFENWHSALEMKLYLKRFIHHVGGLPDFTALRFTRYNQYESMILPMVHYLQEHGVDFQYNTKVVNVEFDIRNGRKAARRIVLQREGREDAIDLTDNDLVFITNGGCVENSAYGSQNEPAAFNKTIREGGGGSVVWPSGQVLQRSGAVELDERNRYDARPQDRAVYREDLQARPVLRQGRYGRHRHGPRFRLASQLDDQSPAAVPQSAEGPARHLGLRPVLRQAGRLR